MLFWNNSEKYVYEVRWSPISSIYSQQICKVHQAFLRQGCDEGE